MDFGTAQAAPVLGLMLAQMGMEVIKVESRTRLDGIRLGRPIGQDDTSGGDQGKWPDLQPSFHAHNRGKLGMLVNLKTTKGIALVKELIKQTDIVIDNYSPGVMQRLGLDHKELEKIKPDIITISLSGAGESGPLRDVVLYAATIQSISGQSSLIGYEGEPILGMSELAYGDANATIHGTLGVLAALWHRNQTGEGQHIELSESEALTSTMGEAVLDYTMNGRVMGATGNTDRVMAPHGNYRCKGNDKWVSIAVDTEVEWAAFCRTIGSPGWTKEARFKDAASRHENRAELDRLVNAWTENFEPWEVANLFQPAGVAAFPVFNIEDQFCDSHFREREIYPEIQHPLVGTEMGYSMPWHFSDMPNGNHVPAPSLGEHNHYVYHDLLGLSDNEIKSLVEQGVIC
ncbi:MAG: CoA transferase [Dehalococcoidales bacterium]|nr:CoA transferase [Dehalococcoidales bacterium]